MIQCNSSSLHRLGDVAAADSASPACARPNKTGFRPSRVPALRRGETCARPPEAIPENWRCNRQGQLFTAM